MPPPRPGITTTPGCMVFVGVFIDLGKDPQHTTLHTGPVGTPPPADSSRSGRPENERTMRVRRSGQSQEGSCGDPAIYIDDIETEAYYNIL